MAMNPNCKNAILSEAEGTETGKRRIYHPWSLELSSYIFLATSWKCKTVKGRVPKTLVSGGPSCLGLAQKYDLNLLRSLFLF